MAKGAAIKGLSKLLRKGTKAKRPRGTPTKAAMMARKSMLRGAKGTPKASDFTSRRETMGGVRQQLKKPKKEPLIGKTEKGIGIGVAGTLAYQKIKEGKKAKAKEAKEKLKKKTTHHYEKAKKKQKDYRKSKK
tara:strand:+ start:137 stop:535 length:399 start_codon:yes stop_codon:yes gene_type:complete